MKDGFYLQAGSYTYYDLDLGDVYERKLWLEDGLVLTDDGRALIRTPPPRPDIYENERYIRIINGERFRTGPLGERPCPALPWYPFCVDGKWGYADGHSGYVAIEPQFAFCDFHELGSYCARYSAKGDFSDLTKECYDGAWGLLDDGLEEAIPPVYQHLSCVQNGVLVAKKDDRWGLLTLFGHEELPFQWDWATFIKSCFVARTDAGGESRYVMFYEGQSYDYKGPPRKGRTDNMLLLDDLTAVTVPEKERDDGLPCYCRLVQRGNRWGVVDCITGETIEPVLTREDAEREFWEHEDRWG